MGLLLETFNINYIIMKIKYVALAILFAFVSNQDFDDFETVYSQPRFEEVSNEVTTEGANVPISPVVESTNELTAETMSIPHRDEDTEYAHRLFDEMGFGGKYSITRQDFKNFFMRMMLREEPEHEFKNFYDKIFDNYIQNIPDTISINDFHNYINFDDIERITHEVIAAEKGEETAKLVQSEY
jgi:hypothetical protein